MSLPKAIKKRFQSTLSQKISIFPLTKPTNNLDKSNRQKVVDFIQKYRHNKSVVFVLDDKPFLEMLKIGTTFKVREEGERLVRGKRNLPVG